MLPLDGRVSRGWHGRCEGTNSCWRDASDEHELSRLGVLGDGGMIDISMELWT